MKDYAYDIAAAHAHLKYVPDEWCDASFDAELPEYWEYERLAEYYPTYKLAHRRILIDGFREGTNIETLVAKKLKVKNTEASSQESLGGHVTWAVKKTRKTVIRLLYLRMRFDWHPRQTKRQANRRLLDFFGDENFGQRAIRDATFSQVLHAEDILK